ncbi:MAG: 30S ribosomal protein S7 [candidate division Zixibacteria bacterium]|nr:30S ribosomal protein S7 [candidate division Zixibacteria bacterium]
MSRRSKAQRKRLMPDPKFNDKLVSQFVNYLMRRGKKSVSESILYDAIEMLSKKAGEEGLDLFHKAVSNVKPVLEVRSRRVGGATYQVPIEVRPERRTALAIRWIIHYAGTRNDKTMADKLASEFMAAANSEGSAIKKKEDTHKMAEANKAFAHFRW